MENKELFIIVLLELIMIHLASCASSSSSSSSLKRHLLLGSTDDDHPELQKKIVIDKDEAYSDRNSSTASRTVLGVTEFRGRGGSGGRGGRSRGGDIVFGAGHRNNNHHNGSGNSNHLDLPPIALATTLASIFFY